MISEADLRIGIDSLQRARRDPRWWIHTTFGEPIIGKQNDILEACAEPGVTEVDVVSCHNSGKTHTIARLVKWWLSIWPGDSKVVTTAPTWPQVENLLWREIRGGYAKAARRGAPLGGRMLTTRWELAEEWYGIGLSTDEPENLQGYHARHLLVVVDEADGIDPQMWTALDSLVTSGHCLMVCIGNPDDPQSEWRKRVTEAQSNPNKRVIRIEADDVTPFFAQYPFMLNPAWVEEKRRLWGETGPRYLSKVKAQWPDQGADTLVPMSWLLAAKGRSVERGLPALGVDVARFGTDRSVRALMEGGWLRRLAVTSQEDIVQTSSKVVQDIDTYAPVAIAIDAIGLGAGVADMVRHARPRARITEFVANAKPTYEDPHEKFADLASQWWWQFRKGLEPGSARPIGFAMDDGGITPGYQDLIDTLINEANQARYGFIGERLKVNKFGLKVTVTEAGMDTEQRAERSPDLADGVVLAWNAALPLVGKKEAPVQQVSAFRQVPGAIRA